MEISRIVWFFIRLYIAHWRRKNAPVEFKPAFDLGSQYFMMGDYTCAAPLFERRLEEARGESRVEYARSLNGLALLYRTKGDYSAAELLFKQALDIRRSGSREGNPEYADTLSDLGVLFLERGEFATAEPLLRQATEIYRMLLDEGKPEYARSLGNLARLHSAMGDYTVAEPLFRQAAEVYQQIIGEDRLDHAEILMGLAELNCKIGDHDAADRLLDRAMKIRLTIQSDRHPEYAQCLCGVGELRCAKGQYHESRRLFEQAMQIYCTALGEDHPNYARSMMGLAEVHCAEGDLATAELLVRRAVEIYRAALGDDHPDHARALGILGGLHLAKGDYNAAEIACFRATSIVRAALGDDHPEHAQSLNRLAALYAATGRETAAIDFAARSAAIENRLIGRISSMSSENRRMDFLDGVRNNYYAYLSLLFRQPGEASAIARKGFDLVLRRKALGAEALAAQRDAVLSGRYPALREKLRELNTLRQQIAQRELAGPELEIREVHEQFLAVWRARRDLLEAELARQIPEMSMEARLEGADCGAVAGALPEGSALVELVRFSPYDVRQGLSTEVRAVTDVGPHPVDEHGNDVPAAKSLAFPVGPLTLVRRISPVRLKSRQGPRRHAKPTGRLATPTADASRWYPPRYLAFITAAGEPDLVQMVDLGAAKVIDGLIADFRESIGESFLSAGDRDMAKAQTAPEVSHGTDAGRALRAAVFDPLLIGLGGCKRILLAPDGDLNSMPFEVLPSDDGRRLIDDYRFSYLSAGRDILRVGVKSAGRHSPALVVADPDFDLAGDIQRRGRFWSRLLGLARPSRIAVGRRDARFQRADVPDGRRSRDVGRAGLRFTRLPGTRLEGERIAGLLGVAPWLGSLALEGRLKSRCRSPWIMHLATHGFYLKDQGDYLDGWRDDVGVPSGLVIKLNQLSGRSPENPLLRSGLALAGANAWLRRGVSPVEAEDGLLTAEDVTGLDLLHTELVVLSACETGLGQVHVGEGVFGLRRAFVLAGAKTLVMSLWKVPDEPTRELMEDFYRRLLAGEGRAEALRQAQLALKVKYPEPFYWGAFICQGDPGPLARVESIAGRVNMYRD
jgi:CHAT domain-containing protein/tetratricopeptide (TPR) repeat protein